MKARASSLQGHLSNGSFPAISSPSMRHENIPEVCRIHSSILSGIMTASRLPLPGSTFLQLFTQHRIPIRLLLRPYMEGRFRQMAGYGSNRLLMALPGRNPLIDPTRMPLRVLFPIQTNRMSRFHVSPFQVMVYVCPQAPIPRPVSTGMDPRRRPRIRRIPLGTRKATHGPDFQG